MDSWSQGIFIIIDEKLKQAKDKDIRFFRVAEFKRNIKRVDSFSSKCPECNRQKIDIAEAVNSIDTAVFVPGRARKDYDRLIGKLSKHMRKEHGFYAPYHFTYIYSFLGIAVSTLLGFLLSFALTGNSEVILATCISLGMISGYYLGFVRDKRIRRENRLM